MEGNRKGLLHKGALGKQELEVHMLFVKKKVVGALDMKQKC